MLKKFGPRTWCTKEPFGYRVVLHVYEQLVTSLRKNVSAR